MTDVYPFRIERGSEGSLLVAIPAPEITFYLNHGTSSHQPFSSSLTAFSRHYSYETLKVTHGFPPVSEPFEYRRHGQLSYSFGRDYQATFPGLGLVRALQGHPVVPLNEKGYWNKRLVGEIFVPNQKGDTWYEHVELTDDLLFHLSEVSAFDGTVQVPSYDPYQFSGYPPGNPRWHEELVSGVVMDSDSYTATYSHRNWNYKAYPGPEWSEVQLVLTVTRLGSSLRLEPDGHICCDWLVTVVCDDPTFGWAGHNPAYWQAIADSLQAEYTVTVRCHVQKSIEVARSSFDPVEFDRYLERSSLSMSKLRFLVSESTADAADNMRVISTNMIEFLTELGSLGKMFSGTDGLLDFLLGIRKKKISEVLDDVSDAVLWYSYGVKPTAEVAQEFRNKWHALLSAPRIPSVLHGSASYLHDETQSDIKIRSKLVMPPPTLGGAIDILHALHNAGLGPLPGQLWESIPFSFVIDRAFGTSSAFKYIDLQIVLWRLLKPSYFVHSISIRRDVKDKFRNRYYPQLELIGDCELHSYRRWVSFFMPGPPIDHYDLLDNPSASGLPALVSLLWKLIREDR